MAEWPRSIKIKPQGSLSCHIAQGQDSVFRSALIDDVGCVSHIFRAGVRPSQKTTSWYPDNQATI